MAQEVKEYELSIQKVIDCVKADANGKCDPYCVCGYLDGKKREVVGKTAVVENNLNPEFPPNVFKFNVDYTKKIYIDIYDDDLIGKNDRFAGVKLDIAQFDFTSKKPYEFDCNKKGAYKLSKANPRIFFTINPIIEAPPAPPAPVEEAVDPNEGKLISENDNKYKYDLFIVDKNTMQYVDTAKEVPEYLEKTEDQIKFVKKDGLNLVIVPYVISTEPFKKNDKITVEFGDAKIQKEEKFRGEFTLAVLTLKDGKFELLPNKYIVDRKNYTEQQWFEQFSQDVMGKQE